MLIVVVRPLAKGLVVGLPNLTITGLTLASLAPFVVWEQVSIRFQFPLPVSSHFHFQVSHRNPLKYHCLLISQLLVAVIGCCNNSALLEKCSTSTPYLPILKHPCLFYTIYLAAVVGVRLNSAPPLLFQCYPPSDSSPILPVTPPLPSLWLFPVTPPPCILPYPSRGSSFILLTLPPLCHWQCLSNQVQTPVLVTRLSVPRRIHETHQM